MIKSMMMAILVAAAAHAEADAGALTKQLKGVKVSLAQGLEAASKAGKPISGKFEIEDGKLQLSVYTAKNDAFFEVIVDHKTGKVRKTEPITSGDDLTAAKAQSEMISSAKTSLAAAVTKAEKANKGYRAVSVIPSVQGAQVTLLKGEESRKVIEPL